MELKEAKPRYRDRTVAFHDIGLVWSLNKRRRVGKNAQILEHVDDGAEEQHDAVAMQKLGLPLGFGTTNANLSHSHGPIYHSYGAEFDSAPVHHAPSGPIPPHLWQQAYDASTGLFYYYCEATQQTQWDQPAGGYLPAHQTWLPEHNHDSLAAAATQTPTQTQTSPYQEALRAYIDHHGWPQDSQKGLSSQIDTSTLPLGGDHSSTRPHQRMETTGMMPHTLQPEGCHLHFDSDGEVDVEGEVAKKTVEEGENPALPPIPSMAPLRPVTPGMEESEEELQHAMEQLDVDIVQHTTCDSFEGDDVLIPSPGGSNSHANGKHRRRTNRRGRSGGALRRPSHVPAHLHKYWLQRYSLFSSYDFGIAIDDEGWFSATPEVIAWHHAKRIVAALGPGCVAVDAFAGVGGNAIQLALAGCHVIAVEIDPGRASLVQHNAQVYGVENKVDVVCADFLEIAPRLRADAVFYSPPWGGPEYSRQESFDVEAMGGQEALGLSVLLKLAFDVMKCKTAVAWLPRNSSLAQIDAALEAVPESVGNTCCEVERAVLNGVQKAVTVYYGAAAKCSSC